MLDDRERRLWQDIESRLVADDPGFRSSMQEADRPRRFAVSAVWIAMFYVVTVILWLLAGWTTAVIGGVAFLIFLPVVLWCAWRYQTARRQGDDQH
jgi:Flp pilus assembly protein TadB